MDEVLTIYTKNIVVNNNEVAILSQTSMDTNVNTDNVLSLIDGFFEWIHESTRMGLNGKSKHLIILRKQNEFT